jgi:hypothetical protein
LVRKANRSQKAASRALTGRKPAFGVHLQRAQTKIDMLTITEYNSGDMLHYTYAEKL